MSRLRNSARLTIHRRCLFCFVEKSGARICLEGRSQTIQLNQQQGRDESLCFNSQSIVECNWLANGMRMGGVKMIRRMWPSRKSDPQSDISTIFTMNSRAGWDIADVPKPLPYHLPVHQARFVSSCLYSRVRKTAIKIF